jgi:hypothetical protein
MKLFKELSECSPKWQCPLTLSGLHESTSGSIPSPTRMVRKQGNKNSHSNRYLIDVVLGFRTQDFIFAKQALYHLSHTLSHFVFVIFFK